jgi:hypothetical protein
LRSPRLSLLLVFDDLTLSIGVNARQITAYHSDVVRALTGAGYKVTDQTRDDRITAALLRRLLTHPYTYVGLDETFTDAGEPTRLVVDGSIDIDAVEAAFVKRIATPNPRWAHEQQSSPDEHPDPHG